MTSASFSWALGIPRFFFQSSNPLPHTHTQYFSTGWVIHLASFSHLPSSTFPLGGNFSVSFNRAALMSRPWVGKPRMFHRLPAPPYLSNWEGAVTCFTAKWNSASQPICEIWEPGETSPNLYGFPEEADGRKGPLLEPKLQFLVESRPRKEVHSGSLCRLP